MIDTETRTDLANISESWKAPKTRMTSARAVREMWGRTDEAYKKRFQRNALVKGLVDGNRPYDQAKLESSAQRYRANFNNGLAESFLNTALTAFYDLFSEVDRLANCQVDPRNPESVPWTDVVSGHFDWLLRQNDRMDWNLQLSFHDMVLYGSGPQIWEDELDWRAKAVGHNKVRLPDGAASNVCDWEWCFVECNYRVDELYALIANPEQAKKRGYNVGEIRKAILKAAPDNIWNGSAKNWLQVQQWIRNNDYSAGCTSKISRCARFYYREFPKSDDGYGTVSEMLIWLDSDTDEPMYHAIDAYEDWRQVICAFFWDRGDGTAHSVRGLGVKMFHLLHALMRMQNAQYDAALASIAVKFKSLSATQSSQLSVTNMGPYQVFMGPFEPITNQGVSNLEPSLAVTRDIDLTLNNNLGQYRQSPEKQTGNPRTAFEVNAELNRQSVLGKTQIARFYQQLDEFYAETFRRAVSDRIPKTTTNRWLKLALEFQERCKQSGVPIEVLRECRVTARRTIGQGSAYMRALSLGQLFSTLYPALPEDGKYNLTDDLIASSAGREAVARYNPAPQLRTREAQQQWEAQVENDTLKNRGQVTITPYHNDVIHLQEHLAFGTQAANALQEGANPAEVFGILQSVGQHSALHLQRLSQNPMRNQEFKLLKKQWDQLAKITDELEKKLREQAGQEAEQAQMAAKAQAVADGTDPEVQLKAAETQAKIQLKAQKQQADLQLKAEKQNADTALKAQQARATLAIQDATTAANIRQATAKTAADIQISKAKAAAQANKTPASK